MARRNEPTTKQVEAAAGFLRDNLHLFGPQACFLETGHIDEIAYGMLRAAGKAAHWAAPTSPPCHPRSPKPRASS